MGFLLEALPTFEQIQADADMLLLLIGIKLVVCKFDQTKSLSAVLCGALKNLYRFYQLDNRKEDKFLCMYKAYYEVIMQSGGD